jgi:hypothetical protein
MKLLVNSEAREVTLSSNNQTSTDIKYNYLLHEDTGQLRCLKLVNALVPRSMYAIVPGWSQRFEFLVVASAEFVTLPEGTYDAATLATELSGLLNGVAAGFTVTYNEKTNKLTFVNATGGAVTINNQVDGNDATVFPDPGVSTILGLGADSVVIANGTSFTAPNMVNMSAPNYLYLGVSSGSVNNNNGIRDWYTRRQFMLTFGETPFMGIKEMSINSEFDQCERVDNQAFRRILVEWTSGIPQVEVNNTSGDTLVKEYPLTFNGIPHTLLFQAS